MGLERHRADSVTLLHLDFFEMRGIGNDPLRLNAHVLLCNRDGRLVAPVPLVACAPGVNVVSSRERTVPIVFCCVSVIRRDVRRIRIGLIGRRRNTLCYGRPAAEPPRNDAGVPNVQQSEIIQPAGRNGRCLPFVSWGLDYAVLIGISP